MNLNKLNESHERIICYLASLQILNKNLQHACGESRIEIQLRQKFENYIETLQSDLIELRYFLTEIRDTEGNLKDIEFLLELASEGELSKVDGCS